MGNFILINDKEVNPYTVVTYYESHSDVNYYQLMVACLQMTHNELGLIISLRHINNNNGGRRKYVS